MYNSSRVWSPPPPSYRTVRNEEAGLSDERTPLKPLATRGKRLATLKVLAFIFVVALLAFHLVSDYTNTNRTDVQDRIRRREDMERAKRIEGEELRRKLAHQQEDKKRRLAYEEEDKRRKVEREREERTIQARLVAVARREDAVWAKEDAILADEERRKRAELVWWDLTSEKRCLGYEKRMYHAELLNVPASEDAHGWCMKTSIDIHGITYDHPELCTSELIDGAVKTIGHWTVSSNEPTCKTWWGDHKKKDCFGAHKRRVEAKLFNHQEPWDNWAEMCFSTPSEFAWQKFDHPDTCENKGRDGIVGSWFIEVDESECP
ncbi:uncharacterized protein BT62DRAFT_921934 [Guyanagaster necrorhizus]|uniref:Uncharacterized protein n=1 Tax=Guyanagaster necrorhizus TaxID=856835 RepID=A0A9P7VN02_9AGAR|nr:uncharacterized protein BT62DRAFT_921934 [Guyanagaster necrorhizus MCA 3950]KAG7443442.1 hypothetical protein BT62DRAFT_921934 [Guyanagaster necrorhizus MCA 3950]